MPYPHLDTTLHWGEGRTSASDGQRCVFFRKVLQQTYSTRFRGFALRGRYLHRRQLRAVPRARRSSAPTRDSAFVLDGLLLQREQPGAGGALHRHARRRRSTSPRSRCWGGGSAPHPRLEATPYRLDVGRDYGPLAGLVGRADRTIDPQVIAEQWDRMGQFYASLESGHTTASVALKRLASCTAKNHFYRANRDLGRVFKTEFLLSYLSEPQLRSRIRRGLLKVEQLHALAGMCITGGGVGSMPGNCTSR